MELSTSHLVDALTYWKTPRPNLENKSAIDHLFNRLDGMYPGKWGKNFLNPVSVQNWKDECIRTFEEEGIRLPQLVAGLRVCREKFPDWPPSVPELANACNPPVDPVAAYHEAIAGLEARGKGEQGIWSHPAIYWAASGMRTELGMQPAHFMKDRWASALKAQLARGQWEPIPAPRVLLAAPGKFETTPEEARRMLAKIGGTGITKTADSKIDHLGWAHKIMARLARGDKTLKPIQVKEARIALGVKTDEGGEEP